VCYVSADVIADGCPYDEESQCTIRLDDNSVVCLRAINRYLALVCQLPVQHYRYEGSIVHVLYPVIPRANCSARINMYFVRITKKDREQQY